MSRYCHTCRTLPEVVIYFIYPDGDGFLPPQLLVLHPVYLLLLLVIVGWLTVDVVVWLLFGFCGHCWDLLPQYCCCHHTCLCVTFTLVPTPLMTYYLQYHRIIVCLYCWDPSLRLLLYYWWCHLPIYPLYGLRHGVASIYFTHCQATPYLPTPC